MWKQQILGAIGARTNIVRRPRMLRVRGTPREGSGNLEHPGGAVGINTVGLFLGPYGSTRAGGRFLMREVPLYA
jgi:hypothetical protein